MNLSSRRKRKLTTSDGSRSTALEVGLKSYLQASSPHVGKCTAELARSGDSMEPANSRPAPSAGSVRLSAFPSVTGKQAAVGRRQLSPSEGGLTYTAVLVWPVAQL